MVILENSEVLLSPSEVAGFEGITRREVYYRLRPGDPHLLISRDWRDQKGKIHKLIYAGSMTPHGRERLQQELLKNASEKFSLVPKPEADRDKLAILIPSASQREQAQRDFKAILPGLDHDYAALGRPKTAVIKGIAQDLNCSVRTVQRKTQRYRQCPDIRALVNKRRGPKPEPGKMLDASAKGYITDLWLKGQNKATIYRNYVNYILKKANSPGCQTHHYDIASAATVRRYINSLDAMVDAAREGPEALTALCGHVDRSYLDLASLERLECDECKLNVFSYDERRPVNRRGEPWIRRYWLLTFYDARSMYPLVWSLCEGSEYELRRGIAVEDEINLFVRLVREYGVPKSIHSDRGRFRGRAWGGEPYQQRIEREFAPVNGILQQVGILAGLPEGIRHDMPRIHNPRGNRLERFHRWVADWFRGKPGWIGANTRERKMTRGDVDAERHKLWCVGKLAAGEKSPLLERNEVLIEVAKMMEAWRDHNSEGTDMNGLTPRAVFNQCSPASGFRRISDKALDDATGQYFKDKHIAAGGIIELPDGSRYPDPLLIPLVGQKREVRRLRHDHAQISVLPSAKGEEVITAKRRARVGPNDPDQLAREMELQKRLRKLAGAMVKGLDYNPEFQDASPQPEAPKAAQVIHPSEFFAAQEAPPPAPEQEISSSEFMMEHDRYKKRKPMDFADVED